MPQHQSAIKRVRQNEKRRARNRGRRSKMRTLVKSVLNSTSKEDAVKLQKEATAYLDKMAVKKVIHPNNAARKKAQITKHVNNLS
ncbi:MAG: 30S ribosomal protein S20 [Balneolaceae bacterium]